MVSQIRQNYHEEAEAALNQQINKELTASYIYMSMYAYFLRDDVSLPGFAKFFKERSDEEREHAEKMIKYQNKRGGRVVLNSIPKPPKDEWGTGLEALLATLELEKSVNQSLLDLHKIVSSHGDAQFADFLESEFLEDQVEDIHKVGNLITQAKRCGSGLGEWELDRNLQS